MIGDMFNQGLKHRVDALCNELTGRPAEPSSRGVEPRFLSQSQVAARRLVCTWREPAPPADRPEELGIQLPALK